MGKLVVLNAAVEKSKARGTSKNGGIMTYEFI